MKALILAALGAVTTNLVVYTNVRRPADTSHYFASKTELAISNGVIFAVRDMGSFDLFSGLPEKDALAVIAERKAAARERPAHRLHLRTNAVEKVTH